MGLWPHFSWRRCVCWTGGGEAVRFGPEGFVLELAVGGGLNPVEHDGQGGGKDVEWGELVDSGSRDMTSPGFGSEVGVLSCGRPEGLGVCLGVALWRSYSGLGVRSSSWCQYTAPDSTASAASRSFLTLAMADCTGFPVKDSMSLAFRMARSQSLWSAVKETSIAM